MAKKLIQTIKGATENTVIYQDDDGAIVAVSRPKVVEIDALLVELGFDAPGKKKRVKKGDKKPAEPETEPSPKPSAPVNDKGE